jgi:hypothetical protein
MCLKFQFTSTSARPIVAMAMCFVSARIFAMTTPVTISVEPLRLSQWFGQSAVK